MSNQAGWLTVQHPSPYFLSSSQVTAEEAPAVPKYIHLARAQGKGHFCYSSARKEQLQVSFSGSPLAASFAGPAFCSPHQGLSPSHLQKKQPLLTGEWEKVPLTLLTILLTITELNNSICTYGWAWTSGLAGTALGQKAETYKLDHVMQHEFSQALTATWGSAPVLREKQTVGLKHCRNCLTLDPMG